MTITYDPHHVDYLNEADVRLEVARALNVCRECRKCVDLCSVFPTAFSLTDQLRDHDSAMMTPAQQDDIFDRCNQCKLCVIDCPVGPGRSDQVLDMPQLMLRAQAMRHAGKITSVRHRMTDRVINRNAALGRVVTATQFSTTIANSIISSSPNSLPRKAIKAVTGVSAVRVLPPFVKQRFSTWFRVNSKKDARGSRATENSVHVKTPKVTIFPTCVVEYHQPSIGQSLVGVYEKNAIHCELSESNSCCGAPFLHSGDIKAFVATAEKQVRTLAAAVRKGSDIVVPQPTCSYVMKHDYVNHLKTDDAYLVATHTYDSSEYLATRFLELGHSLSTEFEGDIPQTVTFHASCHMRAQNTDIYSEQLLQLMGAHVTRVAKCAGIDGLWGLKARNDDESIPVTQNLARELTTMAPSMSPCAGDCHLANVAVGGDLEAQPVHPLEILARAYGCDGHAMPSSGEK